MNGLKSFLFFNELSQLEVAQFLGISKGQMSKLVSGSSSLKAEQLQRILTNNRGWNTEYLTDPVWQKLEDGKFPQKETRTNEGIPLIPLEAVAGPGNTVYEDMTVENYYYVSEFKECDFLIRVKGDSMSPKFSGGDLLACRKVMDTYFLQWGRCYVVYTRSQGVMVKRLQPSEKEGYIRCVSDNEKYAPFDVPTEDIVSLALVSGSITLE